MRSSSVLLVIVAMVFVGFAQSGCTRVEGQAVYEDGTPVGLLNPIAVTCNGPNAWGIFQGWVLFNGSFSISMTFLSDGTCEFHNLIGGYECYEPEEPGNCTFDVNMGQSVSVGVVWFRLPE